MGYTRSEENVAPRAVDHGEGVSHIEPDDVGVGLLTVLVRIGRRGGLAGCCPASGLVL